ncbi:putative laminin A chain [Operophtera brumata]|uniref:Putative laminin A chain n=1 Tax=Operophtera brumata TaxID=104452 RepID=A0A0L7L8A0_OPEBR|nr:putative laminin A chain [Operophtera brumata]
MLQFTERAQHTADAAEKLNSNNRESKFGNKVLSVTKLNSAAMNDIIDTAFDINNATYHIIVGGTVVANSSR